MKPHYFYLLIFVALWPVYALSDLLGLPTLLMSVVIFFAFNWGVKVFNARAMLRLLPIPKRGYDRRREALERDESQLFNLGFRKTDEFYLKSLSDVVVYVYEHGSEPVRLCVYHTGLKSYCDFITKFDGDVSLTTTVAASAGAVKRPPHRLAQIFTDMDYGAMFESHQSGVAFMMRHSLRPLGLSAVPFREFFEKSIREYNDFSRRERFFLLKFVGGMATASAQRYKKPLEQQYPSGLTPKMLAG
ncbi:MAG TPA: hypothetical protein VFZ44_13395 [Pyrinomonadaceae bacterium]